METAPNTGFPYFTPANGLTNTITFTEGPTRLLALPNPFTITTTEEWSVSTFIIINLFNSLAISPTGKDTVFH